VAEINLPLYKATSNGVNKFSDLYDFVDLAQSNRKYTESVANNLKSALKIFGKELNEDELSSVNIVEDRIEEIFRGVANSNKDKNIGSLNTYKARLLRIINDYKKYGANPGKIQNWVVNPPLRLRSEQEKSTPLLNSKDKKDKVKDTSLENLSYPINRGVETHPYPPACGDNMHKIEIALDSNAKALLLIPKNITKPESETLKAIIDSLAKK